MDVNDETGSQISDGLTLRQRLDSRYLTNARDISTEKHERSEQHVGKTDALTNEKLFTLTIGINNLSSAFSADYRLVAAGSMVSIVPIIIFFLAMQRYFISGENDGAVKG